jgi:hypothetical protein
MEPSRARREEKIGARRIPGWQRMTRSSRVVVLRVGPLMPGFATFGVRSTIAGVVGSASG